MNAFAIRTGAINARVAEALKDFATKFVADRLDTNDRTVENWKAKRTGPQVKHVAAILNDPILAPPFLRALGRADLADVEDAKAKLLAAKAALEEIGS